MWFIRITFIFLFHVVLFDQFDKSDSMNFETFFVRDAEACRVRCNQKHGYFVDQNGSIKPVTLSRIRLKVKCSCKPSTTFMNLVRARYGENKNSLKSARGILENGQKSHDKLSKIQFVAADAYQKMVQDMASMALGRSGSFSPGRGGDDVGIGKVTETVRIEGESTLTTTGANKKEAMAAMAKKIAELFSGNPAKEYKVVDMTPELNEALKAI